MAYEAERVSELNCGKCGVAIDPSKLEPLTMTHCPKCGASVRVPAQFGNFLVAEILGSGAAGIVCRAFDQRLHRQVALKILSKTAEDAELVESCTREARALAAHNHQHVVQVYSNGEYRGQPYIVMELLSGGDVEHKLIGKPNDEIESLDVAVAAAEGLAAAYRAGLVHMDVKPGNILYDESGTVKLIDFGVAQVARRSTDQIAGTPYYVAPEVIRGRPADFHADMYSLGSTLFHLLAGRPPFDADDARSLMKKKLQHEAPNLLELRDDLHAKTEKVVAKMLAIDPQMRYADYDDLHKDLHDARVQAELPIEEQTIANLADAATSRSERKPHVSSASLDEDEPTTPWMKIGAIVGLTGAAMLLLVAVVAFSVFGGGEPPSEPATPDPHPPSDPAPREAPTIAVVPDPLKTPGPSPSEPVTPTVLSTSAWPDPSKTYYIDCPATGERLSADGSTAVGRNGGYTETVEILKAVKQSETGEHVEWRFVAIGDRWHIQLAKGGANPRLKAVNLPNIGGASMSHARAFGGWTQFTVTEAGDGKHYITAPDGPGPFRRLRFPGGGRIAFAGAGARGASHEVVIVEVGAVAEAPEPSDPAQVEPPASDPAPAEPPASEVTATPSRTVIWQLGRAENGKLTPEGGGDQVAILHGPATIEEGAIVFKENYFEIMDADAIDLGKDFTISAWIKTDRASGSIVSKSRPTGQLEEHDRRFHLSGGRLSVSIHKIGAFRGDVSVNDDKWHHVVLRVDKGKYALFVDGKMDTEREMRSTPDPPGNVMQIGQFVPIKEQFKGRIRVVRFDNKPLSDEDIAKLAAASPPPAPATTGEPVAPQRPAHEVGYVSLAPTEVDAEHAVEFTTGEDDSVLVNSNRVKNRFTLTAQTDLSRISAFRIEALTDPSLPLNGPGLGTGGRIAVSEITMRVAPMSDPAAWVDIKLVDPHATGGDGTFTIDKAFDGKPNTNWAILNGKGTPQTIVFRPEQPIAYEKGAKIELSLNQRFALGRLRFSATSSSDPSVFKRGVADAEPASDTPDKPEGGKGKFETIRINFGGEEITDRRGHTWIKGEPYREGERPGFVGRSGHIRSVDGGEDHPLGTVVHDITEVRADVPNGRYKVSLGMTLPDPRGKFERWVFHVKAEGKVMTRQPIDAVRAARLKSVMIPLPPIEVTDGTINVELLRLEGKGSALSAIVVEAID